MQDVCKLIADNPDPIKGTNNFQVDSLNDASTATSIEDIIKEDKKFGKFEDHNGEIFYGIVNNRAQLTDSQVRKAVNWALTAWDLLIDTKLVFTTDTQKADFTYEFRATNEDTYLDRDTLAYAGYPNGSLRNIIVINTDFIWTPHGNSISGRELQKRGIKVQFPDRQYKTWDLDQVLRHEDGHKLGLPHSPHNNRIMSPGYKIMAEFLTEEEEQRIWAKYPKRPMSDSFFKKIRKIVRVRSNEMRGVGKSDVY